MTQNLQSPSCYMSLLDASDLFDKPIDLLNALSRCLVMAEGKYVSELKENDLSKVQFTAIQPAEWDNGKPLFHQNKLWLNYKGSPKPFEFNSFQEIRVKKPNVQNIINCGILEKRSPNKPKLASVSGKKKRFHPTPKKVGELYTKYMNEKKNKPKALELWDAVIASPRSYDIDDVCENPENESELVLSYTFNGKEKLITYRNFENYINEFNTGKKLPTGEKVIP